MANYQISLIPSKSIACQIIAFQFEPTAIATSASTATNLLVLQLQLHRKVIVNSTSCRYSVTQGTEILQLLLILMYVLPICGVPFVYCLTLSQLPL